MKRSFTYLFAFMALSFLVSCEKEEIAPEPLAVDKSVTFEVFAADDYSNNYYANHEVSITLRIRRQDKNTMEETTVLDTTFTSILKELPRKAEKLVIRKNVPAVIDENEWVFIGSGYSVGSQGYGKSEFLTSDVVDEKVELSL